MFKYFLNLPFFVVYNYDFDIVDKRKNDLSYTKMAFIVELTYDNI